MCQANGARVGSFSTLNLSRRDMLTPDEVMRFDADKLLLLRPGEAPLVANKVRYFAEPEFNNLAMGGPDWNEPGRGA